MSDYCSHLHRAVSQTDCGLCWLRLEGDQDLIDLRVMELDAPGYDTLAPVPIAFGWDACRAKHIEGERDDESR